jgi:hypothetical protein
MRARAGVEAAVATGILPLDVMLCRMRGEPLPDGRAVTAEMFAAAVAAAPYLHPKLNSASVEMRSDNTHYIVSDEPMTVEEWVQKFGATVEDGDDVAALLPNDADDEPSVN